MKHLIIDKSCDISQIGKDLADILVESKLCESKSEARRKIKEGAIKLGDIKVSDIFARVAFDNEWILIEKE